MPKAKPNYCYAEECQPEHKPLLVRFDSKETRTQWLREAHHRFKVQTKRAHWLAIRDRLRSKDLPPGCPAWFRVTEEMSYLLTESPKEGPGNTVLQINDEAVELPTREAKDRFYQIRDEMVIGKQLKGLVALWAYGKRTVVWRGRKSRRLIK